MWSVSPTAAAAMSFVEIVALYWAFVRLADVVPVLFAVFACLCDVSLIAVTVDLCLFVCCYPVVLQ